jgi:hypothetical protein
MMKWVLLGGVIPITLIWAAGRAIFHPREKQKKKAV